MLWARDFLSRWIKGCATSSSSAFNASSPGTRHARRPTPWNCVRGPSSRFLRSRRDGEEPRMKLVGVEAKLDLRPKRREASALDKPVHGLRLDRELPGDLARGHERALGARMGPSLLYRPLRRVARLASRSTLAREWRRARRRRGVRRPPRPSTGAGFRIAVPSSSSPSRCRSRSAARATWTWQPRSASTGSGSARFGWGSARSCAGFGGDLSDVSVKCERRASFPVRPPLAKSSNA